MDATSAILGTPMLARDQRTPFSDWWWTVDKLLLGAIMALMLGGVILSLAASPPVATRIGLDPFHFFSRHVLFLLPSLMVLLGASSDVMLLLRQALGNLVTNALKFSLPGQPPVITIRAEPRGESLRILVEDRGIGIDRSEQDRLFKPFVRLGAAESYPGTGLGLAIVKKAVERMGGQVGIESAAGRGATFFVELPRSTKEL